MEWITDESDHDHGFVLSNTKDRVETPAFGHGLDHMPVKADGNGMHVYTAVTIFTCIDHPKKELLRDCGPVDLAAAAAAACPTPTACPNPTA